ncbi:hypothetical protein JTB14_034622 [Gonioctena quinquepunctata]|nr:hypothetical protein JTB14_034622 [Gonioctena quinquepunctata]
MLDEFTNWCSVWRVQLNPNKTQTILFKHPNNSQKPSQKSNEINLTLLGERLELQDEVCYLGVTFTRTLNWQTDLDKTLIKVRQRASILRSLGGHFGRCHPETLLHTYKTFIRPILDYKSNIYAVLTPKQEYAIKTTERRILRTCQYLPRLSPSNEVYDNIDFDPILTRFQKLRQGYVDRVIRGGNEAAKATLLWPKPSYIIKDVPKNYKDDELKEHLSENGISFQRLWRIISKARQQPTLMVRVITNRPDSYSDKIAKGIFLYGRMHSAAKMAILEMNAQKKKQYVPSVVENTKASIVRSPMSQNAPTAKAPTQPSHPNAPIEKESPKPPPKQPL